MAAAAPSESAFRVADLPNKGERAFEVALDAETAKALAEELGVDGLRKLRFDGTVSAQGKRDWRLDGMLGATVVQSCSVTLAPVTTRIDVAVTRLFVADYAEPETLEAEMPEDDTVEALGPWIDPKAVMIEALSLEIPQYPRADGASLGETVLTEAGKEPLRDADLKPFAGLAALKAQMGDGEDG